jgi:hypothetical protein
MHSTNTNDGAPDRSAAKISGLVWLAVLCLALLGGLGIGYMAGFGFSSEPKSPELTIATSDWRPVKPIELVVMAGEGGGADKLARVIKRIAEDDGLAHQPIILVNKAGLSQGQGRRPARHHADPEHDLHDASQAT